MQARYSLSVAEREDLSNTIKSEFNLDHPVPNLVGSAGLSDRYFLVVRGDHPAADVARTREFATFREFFGYDEAEMRSEYGPYEADSYFVMIYDPEAQVADGVVRAIEGKSKTVIDLRDRKTEDGERFYKHSISESALAGLELRTVEIATAARDMSEGGLMDGVLLYAGITKWVLERGHEVATASLDPHIRDVMIRDVGMRWRSMFESESADAMPEVEYHAGGSVVPAYIDLRTVSSEMEEHSQNPNGGGAAMVVQAMAELRLIAPASQRDSLSPFDVASTVEESR